MKITAMKFYWTTWRLNSVRWNLIAYMNIWNIAMSHWYSRWRMQFCMQYYMRLHSDRHAHHFRYVCYSHRFDCCWQFNHHSWARVSLKLLPCYSWTLADIIYSICWVNPIAPIFLSIFLLLFATYLTFFNLVLDLTPDTPEYASVTSDIVEEGKHLEITIKRIENEKSWHFHTKKKLLNYKNEDSTLEFSPEKMKKITIKAYETFTTCKNYTPFITLAL